MSDETWVMNPEDEGVLKSHVRYLTRLGRRPRTIIARRDAIKRFQKWKGTGLLETTRDEIETYLDTTKKPATHRVYLAHIRGFFRWCVDEEILAKDPTRRVVGPNQPRGVPRPISEGDLARALAAAPPLEYAWMMLAAFGGLRACEVGPVRGEHVIRGARPYLIIPEGKGGGEYTVPLCPELLAELDKWPSTGWLWKADGAYHWDVVSRRVGKVLSDLGIRAGMHSLRHRFGTQAYIMSKGDLRHTQELLRHQSPATTATYTQLDPREAYDIVCRLPMPTLTLVA